MITVTEVLNIWNEIGVFSYVIPFLLIFAIIYAILEKTQVLGRNNMINSIVAISVGLLSLQFDFVPTFFAIIFPRFGIGLSVFLILVIAVGFFWPNDEEGHGNWIGYVIGIGVAIWAITSWDEWGYYNGFGGWFSQNIWAIIILAALITIIIITAKSKSGDIVKHKRGGG